MPPSLRVQFFPAGPWRIGPDSGDRDRVDRIFHSDSLYSAVSRAMAQLGLLDEWLDATARAAEPAVRFSSCFPFHNEIFFVVPPRNLWPPPPSAKVRWKGAKFVPFKVVETLVNGVALIEDEWTVDSVSECLVPAGASGPFRVSVRSAAAVDRGGMGVAPHSAACLEFTPGAGLWAFAAFSDDAARDLWSDRLRGALRLLADSGFGGQRSRGWGRTEEVLFSSEERGLSVSGASNGDSAWWILSLFHPAESDAIDWQRGSYALTTRGGRIESEARWGEPKKPTRMVAEGSVLVASAEPRGAVANVAPEDFPHPVYRAGFALAIPVPLSVTPSVTAARPAS